MTRTGAALAALVVARTLVPAVAPARAEPPPPSGLDLRFGHHGRVITEVSGNYDEANGIAIQPDGRIVVAGSAFFRESGAAFVVARYLADGRLDPSFGTAGIVRTEFTEGSDAARDVALQSDGKIVAAGFTRFGEDFAVARYEADGSLDTSFGSGGRVVVDLRGDSDMAWAVAVQNDGGILVAGKQGTRAGSPNFGLVRLRSDGRLDGSFGERGIVTTDFFGDGDLVLDLALQTDGRIVAVGQTSDRGSRGLALARYEPDGDLDPSFGDGGKTATLLGGWAEATGVAVRADGRLVVGGSVELSAGEVDFLVARYLEDGSLDATFGDAGLTQIEIPGEEYLIALVLEESEAILAAGLAGPAFSNQGQDFALARFTPSGRLDRRVGRGGVVRTDFSGDRDRANDLALSPDGGIVLAGGTTADSTDPGESFDFALARYRYQILFADDFDSGDSSAWNQTRGNVEVVSPGLRRSRHALEVTVNGRHRRSFVRTRGAGRERSIRLGFQLLANVAELGAAKLEILRASSGRKAFQLLFEHDRGAYFISLLAWESSGSVRPVGRTEIPGDRAVRLTVDWCAATTDAERNGVARLLLGRRVIAEALDLDNARLAVSSVRLGLPSGSRGAPGGTFLVDDYASFR